MNFSQASPGGTLLLLIEALLWLAAIGTPLAFGRDDLVPGSRYTSARNSAMGDTCIGLVEDTANSLFCNPSGLPRVRGLRAEPVNISLFTGMGIMSAIGLDIYKVTDLEQYKSKLRSITGTPISFGGSVLPSVSWRFIGLGVLLQSSLGAVAVGENIRYHTRYELIPAVNLAYRFASGIFKVGYSLQWVNKTAGTITVPAVNTLAWNDGLYQGSGLSHTAGASLTLPMAYLPQFNFVARNIAGTVYSLPSILPLAANSAGSPPTEPMTFDVSVGVNPKFGTGYFANIILTFKDLLSATNQSLLGKIGGGGELVLAGKFAFRGGYMGGYPSAGLGYRHKGGEFNVSYYTEELGGGYMLEPDVRIMVQYQLYGSTTGNKR